MHVRFAPTNRRRLSGVAVTRARPRRTALPSESFGSLSKDGGRHAAESQLTCDVAVPLWERPGLPRPLSSQAAAVRLIPVANRAIVASCFISVGTEMRNYRLGKVVATRRRAACN